MWRHHIQDQYTSPEDVSRNTPCLTEITDKDSLGDLTFAIWPDGTNVVITQNSWGKHEANIITYHSRAVPSKLA